MKNNPVLEGVSDAIGFVGGALLGFWAGQLLGWDVFAQGYGNASMGGILLCGIGGGLGVQGARLLRARHQAARNKTTDKD